MFSYPKLLILTTFFDIIIINIGILGKEEFFGREVEMFSCCDNGDF